MRDIAFRVWDRTAAAWRHFSLRPLSDSLPDLADPDIDQATLSQDTGIKDKHGNPIFEGDLLEDRLGTRCIVTFNVGHYMLVLGDNSASWPLSGNGSHYEVVGNIVESPQIAE